jgi:hypothetical protein
MSMTAVLEVIGADDPPAELETLLRYLSTDDTLRGVDIEPVLRPPPTSAMGPVLELLEVAASSGAGMAVVRALAGWLGTRDSRIKIKSTVGEVCTVVDLTNVRDPAIVAELLRALTDS